jgi:transposase
MASEHTLHMQKSLNQMNIQIHHVLSGGSHVRDRRPKSDSTYRYRALCPEKQISGGKVLSCKTRKVKNRTAIALRIGPNSLCHAKGYFGEFFRRMRAKLGTAQAVTATAHKIARILYHVLLTKQPHAETLFHRYDQDAQQRAETRLRKQAAVLGFQLIPNTDVTPT